MIFEQHDFSSNFDGISKSKDVQLQRKMIISEISHLIVKDRAKFIEMMRMAGYTVDDSINDIDLADMIVSNLGKDKKLATGVAYMIVQNNQEPASSAAGDCSSWWYRLWHSSKCNGSSNAPLVAGEHEDTGHGGVQSGLDTVTEKWPASQPKEEKTTSASGIISSLANLTNGVFGYLSERQEGKNQAEQDKMTLVNNLIAMRAQEQQQPKQNNTALYVVLGVVGALAIGAVIYFATRKKAAPAKK